jgi:CheY-like chemotaxis protein
MENRDVEVLLVEDNPHDAELALRALRQRQLAQIILHVQDGEEALDFLRREGRFAQRSTAHPPPRVVLLDLKLPKRTGLEVLQEIKSDPRTRAIPVVMLTSSRECRDLEEAYRLGANSYIVKPVEFQDFSEAVAQLGAYWLQLNEPPDGMQN